MTGAGLNRCDFAELVLSRRAELRSRPFTSCQPVLIAAEQTVPLSCGQRQLHWHCVVHVTVEYKVNLYENSTAVTLQPHEGWTTAATGGGVRG